MDCRIAEEHIGVGVPLQRFVFGEAFVKPERKLQRYIIRDDRLDRSTVEHIVDNGVGKFVMNDMLEFRVVSFEWKDDAILKEFGYSADTFIEIFVDNVRLLKIVMRIVDNDRDPVRDLVPERSGEGGEG